jgi:hypothetical protein
MIWYNSLTFIFHLYLCNIPLEDATKHCYDLTHINGSEKFFLGPSTVFINSPITLKNLWVPSKDELTNKLKN